MHLSSQHNPFGTEPPPALIRSPGVREGGHTSGSGTVRALRLSLGLVLPCILWSGNIYLSLSALDRTASHVHPAENSSWSQRCTSDVEPRDRRCRDGGRNRSRRQRGLGGARRWGYGPLPPGAYRCQDRHPGFRTGGCSPRESAPYPERRALAASDHEVPRRWLGPFGWERPEHRGEAR